MANEAVIMDDGEPYVHIETLVAYLTDKGTEAAGSPVYSALVPGIAVVVDFLTKEHDRLSLADRKD
jgi:hypothetical protein